MTNTAAALIADFRAAADEIEARLAQLRRSQHAAMVGNQLAVLAHEAGHGPAELGHAGGDLRDLLVPVLLGILPIGLQARSGQDSIRSGAKARVMRMILS
jgi:hypothetical protein